MSPEEFPRAVYGAVLGAAQASGGAQAGASYVTLEWPGFPVDPRLYGNVWASDNQGGSPEALEYFSGMADDDSPVLSPIYEPTGISVAQVYSLILKATAPAGPIASAFATAQTNFDLMVRASLQHEGVFHPTLPAPRTWCDASGEGGWTTLRVGEGAGAAPAPPAVIGTVLARPSLMRWALAPAVVAHRGAPSEGPVPVMASHTASVAAAASPKRIATLNVSTQRATQVAFRPGALQVPVVRPKPAVFDAAIARLRIAGPVRVTPVVPTVPPATVAPVTSTKLAASLRYIRVQLHRPWMDTTLFRLPGWSIPGVPAAFFSTGEAANNAGLLPLLPVGFIAVRDVRITGAWSDADRRSASQAVQATGPAAFGPFAIRSGGQQSSFDGSTLTIPGIQIIAWTCQVMPKSPPGSA